MQNVTENIILLQTNFVCVHACMFMCNEILYELPMGLVNLLALIYLV